jgi:hypothetical protein
MISLLFGILNALSANPLIATAEAAAPPVDTSGVLDLEQSPEEKMVGGDLPATPESGNENPEDLLKSGPVIKASKRPTTSASATGDGLPASLPLAPGSKKSLGTPPPANDYLPPVPSDTTPIEDAPLSEAPPADSPPENLENVVVPADADAVASDSESGTSTKKYDRTIPMYEREKPSWGVDIHSSLQAFSRPIYSEQLNSAGAGTGVEESSDVVNFGFGLEYQPQFLQGIGLVSIGPSFNSYILQPAGDITNGAFSIYAFGISAKYQLNYFRGQPIVPFVGFEAQMIHYKFERSDLDTGWTTAAGLTFGALIGLNWMEPSAAHTLWAETGIKRSYLVAEVKNLVAPEALLSSDGPALYFGLRLEY